jgi:hypothetical protein
MPVICSICEAVIRADIQQGSRDKPICKVCLKEIIKARAFVQSHNESISKGVKK